MFSAGGKKKLNYFFNHVSLIMYIIYDVTRSQQKYGHYERKKKPRWKPFIDSSRFTRLTAVMYGKLCERVGCE